MSSMLYKRRGGKSCLVTAPWKAAQSLPGFVGQDREIVFTVLKAEGWKAGL